MDITPSLHALMALFVTGLILGILLVGKQACRKGSMDKAARYLGFAVMGVWLAYNVYYFLPTVFQWSVSLPLHICDALAPVTFLALVCNIRKARAILYFCAIPFAGMVVLNPLGNQNPDQFRFWFYWSFHAGLLAASFFDIVIRSFRSTRADLCTALLFDMCYVLVILPIDVMFGWNYGYIGKTGSGVSDIIDHFGPWPQRVLWLLLATLALQTCMFIIPKLVERRHQGCR